MHTTAMENGKRFFDTYVASLPAPLVLDIGAQDVNGSLKSVCPGNASYIGVDFVAGKGVDVVLTDPYKLPFPNEHADVIVSSSCFEHSEMFWVLFLEILRVLKPAGLFYLNAPSNGAVHRYPVDCWRFYPDSGTALIKWAKMNGFDAAALESYTSNHRVENWRDFVCVFVKESAHAPRHRARITDQFRDFTNGLLHPEPERFSNFTYFPEGEGEPPQPPRRRPWWRRLASR